MKSFRIKPITGDRVGLSISCDCGRAKMTREGLGMDEFMHSVAVGYSHHGRAKDGSFKLLCACGRIYHVQVQSDHFHVTELERVKS